MDEALAQFHENVERARTMSGLADALPKVGMVGLDISDLHRAAVVLGVSALDFFVHEVVRTGIVKSFEGKITATDANLAFKVSLASVHECLADPADNRWLESSVRASHAFLTFQHPEKIADAIRMISGVRLWERVAEQLGTDAKSVKTNLTAIVDRRNKIAHEADMDHLSPGTRWPIDHAMVNEALDFILAVVDAIADVADDEKTTTVVTAL